MDFSKIGEAGFFNTEMFTTQIGSWNTWKGVVAGAASTGMSLVTNSVLNSLNMKQVNGFNSQQIQSMEAMNGFVGSLTGIAVEYAIARQTTVNLLNLADIGQMFGIEGLMKKDEAGNLTGEYHRSGLVELRLGGDEGFKLAVGTAGTDMGIGVVSSALDGLNNHIMNGRIQGYVSKSGLNIGDSLRSQWGFGDSAAMNMENYLLFNSNAFSSEKEVLEAGYSYYLAKYSHYQNSERTHWVGFANGIKNDPDSTTINRWWENDAQSSVIYYGLAPKF